MIESLKRCSLVVSTMLVLSVLLNGCLLGEDAGDAAKDRFLATSRGDYADAWKSLHPKQQTIVSEDKFVECGEAGEANRPPEISDVKVLDETVEQKDIPEVGTVEAHVIQLEWKQAEDTRQGFFDMVKDDGDWKWVLDATALESFRTGECPR